MKLKRKYNKQPNVITQSSADMTLIEKRLMYIVINRMSVGINVNSDLFKNLDFTVHFNTLGSSGYSTIKKAIKKLHTRTLKLIDDDTKKQFESFVPFPHVKIANSSVTVTMLANVVPHFLELRKGYTNYELRAALTLNSIYSQKFYELFSRWKDKKEWLVDLEELQKLLNATNYSYKDFRINCLEVGIPEVNEKTELSVSYEPIKEGRSVKKILFIIDIKKSEKEMQAEEAIQDHEEEMELVSQLSSGQIAVHMNSLINEYEFSKSQKNAIISNKILMDQFIDLDSKIANGVIKNVQNRTRYIASILFNHVKSKNV
jgi:plasmid replication initiation protein